MAKKEGYVVDLNKLYRYDDTTGNFVIPKALWANGKEYYAAFSNGSLCYNKALYELYLEGTELVALASGVIMDPYVYVSIKKNFDGTETEVEVTDTLEDIEPNYSLTEERTGTFSVTQATSNFVLTGTYRQRKDSYTDEYCDLKITNVVCPLIPASGGSRPLTVYYSCMSVRRYESGKEETEEITESTTAFTDVDIEVASGASFDYSTGKLSGSNLGYNVTAESTIATVTYVSISAYGLTDDWSGSQVWKQEANSREKHGELQYNVSIRVDGAEEVLPGTTYTMLVASATKTQYYIYTAKPDDLFPETSPATGTLTASSGATVSPTSITGSGQSVKFSFPVNTDEEKKTYSATITAGGESATAEVVQLENINSWLSPTINGTWSVSNISAAGGSTTVRVPIVQLQVNTSGVEVNRYTGWADAIAIGGTAGNGGSVSGGTVSAPNLGQTATSERTVFTITSVKIKSGGDGKEYTISVSPSVAVKQDANYQWVERSRYNVSITPQGNIPALGGSAALLVNAYEWVYYYWASAPSTPTNETGFSMTGYVTAASGTISGSPIVGTGKQVTLAYNTENFGAARSITVSLRAVSGVGLPDINISKEVTQSAASYVLTAGSDKECNATASTVYVTFTSSRNGKVWEPTFTTNNADATINKSGITLSDTTYTVPVTIKANSSSSNRDIIVTATQSRYSGDVTATVTITQAGAAQNLPLAGVILNECMYTSDALTSVSYSFYFTASSSSSYQGGTLSNVVVQLNTAANGSGSVLASKTIGNVTVSRGSNSSTYSGTLNSGGRVAYLLVYWGGRIQFATEVEEYVPEG